MEEYFEYRSDGSLDPGESYIAKVYCCKLSLVKQISAQQQQSVTIHDYNDGDVVVTSHRLMCRSAANATSFLCLHLKDVAAAEQMKNSLLGFSKLSRKILITFVKMSDAFCVLCFKDRIDTDFLDALQQTLQQRSWLSSQTNEVRQPPSTSRPKPRSGIVGIERNLEEKHRATNETISVAFQDFDKLILMAKQMVKLSKSMAEKCKENESEAADETLSLRSNLLSLGVDDPVTRQAFRHQSDYYKQLAVEINLLLDRSVNGTTQQGGTMMTLAEAYCRVNRARGLELLSPEDFLYGCELLYSLPETESKVQLRTFDSGVRALQGKRLDEQKILGDTVQLLRSHGPLAPDQLARHLGISVLLAKERLVQAETHTLACRDQSIQGLFFYYNRFVHNS